MKIFNSAGNSWVYLEKIIV